MPYFGIYLVQLQCWASNLCYCPQQGHNAHFLQYSSIWDLSSALIYILIWIYLWKRWLFILLILFWKDAVITCILEIVTEPSLSLLFQLLSTIYLLLSGTRKFSHSCSLKKHWDKFEGEQSFSTLITKQLIFKILQCMLMTG